jgi:hypothetical protein
MLNVEYTLMLRKGCVLETVAVSWNSIYQAMLFHG